MKVKTTIRKDRDTGEYVVKLYINGKHQVDADYFAEDKDDAECTARDMETHSEMLRMNRLKRIGVKIPCHLR